MKLAMSMMNSSAQITNLARMGSEALVTALGLLVVYVVLYFVTKQLFFPQAPLLRLPPGPPPVPVLGNFLSMLGAADKFHVLDKFLDEYGPIITVWFGNKCVIVVKDPAIAHEVLVGSGVQFSSRVTVAAGVEILNSSGVRMINSAPYGAYWRSVRKNLAAHVLSKGARDGLQPIREEEVSWLVETLKAKSEDGSGAVHLLEPIRLAIGSIFFRACFGIQHDDKSAVGEFTDTLDRLMAALNFQLFDFLPVLAPLLSKKHEGEIRFLLRKLEGMAQPLIAEHRELRKKGGSSGDYVDSILTLQEETGLSESDLLGLVLELHFGGIDTSTRTTEFTLAELVTHPEVQNKMFEEISRVVGTRPVVEDDLQNLPYLRAVAMEGLRRHPPLPFLLGHGVVGSKSAKLVGYDIPETAMVMITAKRIQSDPRFWNDPESFNPERFLDSDGNVADLSELQSRCLIVPFGAGRRICPGMTTGITVVQFFLARLVQSFRFLLADPLKPVDFTEIGGGIIAFKNHFKARLTER